jgi:hypothetical protein
MKMLLRPLPLVLALAFSGCVTKKQIASRPSDAGIKSVHKQDFDRVKRAALDAIGELHFEVKEETWADEYRYRIIGSQGLSGGTTGRLVRIMIEKGDSERTVHILVEAKTTTQDATVIDGVIAQDLQKKLAARLAK